MKEKIPFLILFITAVTVVVNMGAATAVASDDARLFASQEELQWFRNAKFGMFIHWGPVSLTGAELSWGRDALRPYDWKGDVLPSKQEGAEDRLLVSQAEYDSLYLRFNPVEFDADEWVRIARDAGMKYMVFTTKHHDGFSNFHTHWSEYSIEHSPFKRDIVAELTGACHRGNMPIGLYYSARDWHHPDYLTERHEEYLRFYHGQVEELCNNYGEIDIMWFDHLAGLQDQWRPGELIRQIRTWQPGVLINNRIARIILQEPPDSLKADYDTPEHTIGAYQKDRPWESCITLVGHQWSWKPDGELMSLKDCVGTLVRCVCGDGNLLLNIGPMPTGEIEPRQINRLREIGDWLEHYGGSIYGTRGGPIPTTDWGGSTNRGNVVYVHVLEWPKDDIVITQLPGKVVSRNVLTGGRVTVTNTTNGIAINVPESDRQNIDTIIVLELDKNVSN